MKSPEKLILKINTTDLMSFKPTPSQEVALKAIQDFVKSPVGDTLNDRVLVLTGQAGTGKTTILKYALQELIEEDLKSVEYSEDDFFSDFMSSIPNVFGVAVAHKAKLRLMESIPNAATYAGYFGLKPVYGHDGSIKFEKQKMNDYKKYPHELPFRVVVHDEVSMYDMSMINFIEEFTNSSSKLILTGDRNQLPPIMEGIQGIDIDSPAFSYFTNIVHLEERVRQTVGNPILDLATEIHKEIFGENNVQRIVNLIKNDRFSDGVGYRTIKPESLIQDFIQNYKEDDSTRVICYRNKKIETVNKNIRKKLFNNPDESFVQGDALYMNLTYTNVNERKFYNSEEFRILNIEEVNIIGVHCYKALVKHEQGASITLVSERGKKEYNSILKEKKDEAINSSFKFRKKAWENYYKFRDLFADVSYGYAFTAYKAQGSGFTNVYVDVGDIMTTPISDKRKLQTLYTAVTRATHQVIFF